MAANSTLGINVYYAWQSDGTRPTTGYVLLSDEIVEAPAQDSAPQGLDATPLSETKYVRRIPGLIDNGDDYSLTCNFSQTLLTSWASIVAQVPTKIAAGNYLEIMIVVPGYTDAFYFCGTPIEAGYPGSAVNEVFQGALHITPYITHGWTTKATITTA